MDERLSDRYVVVKRKHLTVAQDVNLEIWLEDNGIPTVGCVVIEEDWPQYKPTVDSLFESRD